MQLNNFNYLKRNHLRHNLRLPKQAFGNCYKAKNQWDVNSDNKIMLEIIFWIFIVPHKKIAIELDGAGHYTEEGIKKDETRTQFLNELGIKVLRFENKLVFEKTEWVLDEISRSFAPLSPPAGGLRGQHPNIPKQHPSSCGHPPESISGQALQRGNKKNLSLAHAL